MSDVEDDIILADLNDEDLVAQMFDDLYDCLLYTSPSPRDKHRSRMPSSA